MKQNRMKKEVFAFAFLAIALALINFASAVNVNSCQNLNSAGATYVLQNDITQTGKVCFNITAGEVVLDCNNKTLTVPTNSNGIVAEVGDATIKNCKIIIDHTKLSHGIVLNLSAGNCVVDHNYMHINGSVAPNITDLWWDSAIQVLSSLNEITNNVIDSIGFKDQGIVLESTATENVVAFNSIVVSYPTAHSGEGIRVDGAVNDIMENTIDIRGSQGFGIYLLGNKSYSNEVEGNVIEVLDEAGIRLYKADQNYIHGNKINGSKGSYGSAQGISVYDADQNKITRNIITTTYNCGIALYESTGLSLEDNIVTSSLEGICLGNISATTLKNNTANSNQNEGIKIGATGTGNTFNSNIACFNNQKKASYKDVNDLGTNTFIEQTCDTSNNNVCVHKCGERYCCNVSYNPPCPYPPCATYKNGWFDKPCNELEGQTPSVIITHLLAESAFPNCTAQSYCCNASYAAEWLGDHNYIEGWYDVECSDLYTRGGGTDKRILMDHLIVTAKCDAMCPITAIRAKFSQEIKPSYCCDTGNNVWRWHDKPCDDLTKTQLSTADCSKVKSPVNLIANYLPASVDNVITQDTPVASSSEQILLLSRDPSGRYAIMYPNNGIATYLGETKTRGPSGQDNSGYAPGDGQSWTAQVIAKITGFITGLFGINPEREFNSTYVAEWDPTTQSRRYMGAYAMKDDKPEVIPYKNDQMKPYMPYFIEPEVQGVINWVGKLPEPATVELKNVPGTYSYNYISLKLNTEITWASQLCKLCNDGTICDDSNKWVLNQSGRITEWDVQQQIPIASGSGDTCEDIIIGAGTDFEVEPGKVYQVVANQSASVTPK
jgi:parallel beta-helix repeat protein